LSSRLRLYGCGCSSVMNDKQGCKRLFHIEVGDWHVENISLKMYKFWFVSIFIPSQSAKPLKKQSANPLKSERITPYFFNS